MLTEGRYNLTEACFNLTEGHFMLTEACCNLTEGYFILAEACYNLAEGRFTLADIIFQFTLHKIQVLHQSLKATDIKAPRESLGGVVKKIRR